jgi:hypothetical protein
VTVQPPNVPWLLIDQCRKHFDFKGRCPSSVTFYTTLSTEFVDNYGSLPEFAVVRPVTAKAGRCNQVVRIRRLTSPEREVRGPRHAESFIGLGLPVGHCGDHRGGSGRSDLVGSMIADDGDFRGRRQA